MRRPSWSRRRPPTTSSAASPERAKASTMQIQLPQADGSIKSLSMKARPIAPEGAAGPFNRVVYAAAHVVIDPLASVDPWDAAPAVDWDATLAFRDHLHRLGFKVAEAMDTAQRGMGV